MSKTIVSKKKPEKRLTRIIKKKGGRNNTGRITMRHKGGGAKRKYRIIEFGEKLVCRQAGGFPYKARVLAIEYDPNRTAYIALMEKEDSKEKFYIIAPEKLKEGDVIEVGEKAPILPGNRMRLFNIPSGTVVSSVELFPGQGAKIARSAGNWCQTMGVEGKYVNLIMPSTEIRKVLGNCFATIGAVSRGEHRFEKARKAGDSRNRGIRPTVRGSAMNPVDHPHGGGEGKAPVGLKHPKTPWGKVARGGKTRNPKKWTNKLITKRRKKKKKK